MINRENWKDVREYLAYKVKTGLNPETALRVRNHLRHFLIWADEKGFPLAKGIDASFPTYLEGLVRDDGNAQLGAATLKKTCDNVRLFLDFMRQQHPARYRALTPDWIKTVKPSTGRGTQSEYHEHMFFSLEQVRQIAEVHPRNLKEERDQAAIVFLFLSAMRMQAFLSLPAKAVDLERQKISQFPKWGVRTKRRKAAKTTLLRIPELLEVVRKWDRRVRKETDGALWYPVMNPEHQFVTAGEMNWSSRKTSLWRGMRVMCELAGVPFMSPHKLRHGHAVLVMRQAKTMKHIDSLRANLMHENIAITTGIYSKLVSDDLDETYAELGEE